MFVSNCAGTGDGVTERVSKSYGSFEVGLRADPLLTSCASLGRDADIETASLTFPFCPPLCDSEVEGTAVRVQPRLGAIHLR